VSLLAQVSAVLGRAGMPHAVIGAAALAAHGVTRATADVDVLTTDAGCLVPTLWVHFRQGGIDVDVRRGDAGDPLAGVVRVGTVGESPVDVIVGRAAWQEAIVRRAIPTTIAGAAVPIVGAADLVLLKLYAGGSQDAWDVDQLLDAVPGIEREVEVRLGDLPPECTALWRRILTARAGTSPG
jgi:hypothetical protein